jgi:type IV secretory pathway component VirB8
MKKYTEPTPEDYIEIAEKVRSGEYFRESKAMYDIMVNDAISERYLYVIVSIISLLTMIITFNAMDALYPLQRIMAFVNKTDDMVNENPYIYKLKRYPEQSTDEAIILYYAGTYVQQYEEYDIRTLERNMNGLRSTSSAELFANYQRMMQPTNPESPVVKYQRHSTRQIQVLSTKPLQANTPTIEVIFNVIIRTENTSQTTKYRALVSYEYSNIEIEMISGKIKPPTFLVTSYSSKPI